MSARPIDYLYIASTIGFTVYSQLIMRWQVGLAGAPPADPWGKAQYIGHLLLNPWVITGVVATFCAGVSWMLTMTRFELSHAFPFMALNYVLILAAGMLVFGEVFTANKAIGTLLVVAGIVVVARG